ncbi:MAG: hypothetical protein R3Y64_01240 [Peptostreptococcaceae bacterium]
MSFINNFSTIIRKSNEEIIHIYEDGKLHLNFFDENNYMTNNKILDHLNQVDSSYCHFSLIKDDTVYGIFKDEALKMIEIDENKISTKTILSYNNYKYDILYPYINLINNEIHIFYYVFDNKSNTNCMLIHHHYKNDYWRETRIDKVSLKVINNYEVVVLNEGPMVFYMSTVNSVEEIFCSKFNYNTLRWSKPQQITSSGKNKIYLSVLEDNNVFHITFCENENSCYSVKYINGRLDAKENFNLDISSFVSPPSACIYPSILKEEDTISILWVDFNKIYKAVSNDFGRTFGEITVDDFSANENFSMSKFLSNSSKDMSYKSSNVFSLYKDISILGI